MSQDRTNEDPAYTGQEQDVRESLLGSSYSYDEEVYIGFTSLNELADSNDD